MGNKDSDCLLDVPTKQFKGYGELFVGSNDRTLGHILLFAQEPQIAVMRELTDLDLILSNGDGDNVVDRELAPFSSMRLCKVANELFRGAAKELKRVSDRRKSLVSKSLQDAAGEGTKYFFFGGTWSTVVWTFGLAVTGYVFLFLFEFAHWTS